MKFIEPLNNFKPKNEQEEMDYKIIIDYVKDLGAKVLYRDNYIAHITSSGFIMNPKMDKVLMIHHNIRNTWAWTGGHADGEDDLLNVAIKEAREETGVKGIKPLVEDIAAIDILPSISHIKNNQYVNTHLHLSIAYVLICNESEGLHICPNENSAVEWLSIHQINEELFDKHDIYLYKKLIDFAYRYK